MICLIYFNVYIDMIYVLIMELRQLQYFLAVAETLHFGRAAKRMNISQPPLSMQIRNLEDELGFRLFKRSSRKVEATPAGRLFAGEVTRILGQLEAAVETARSADKGETGRLSMACISPAMDTFLPSAVRSFRERNPGIVLSIKELTTNQQLKALYTDQIQVGFLRLFDHDLKNLCSRVVWKEPHVVAIPKGDALCSKSKISLCDLKSKPMIIYPRPSQPALYDRVMAHCRMAGFVPEIVQEAETKHATTALVAAGIGVSIVPASSRNFRKQDVVYRPVIDALPEIEISMVWRGDDDAPVLERFLSHMKDKAQSQN